MTNGRALKFNPTKEPRRKFRPAWIMKNSQRPRGDKPGRAASYALAQLSRQGIRIIL